MGSHTGRWQQGDIAKWAQYRAPKSDLRVACVPGLDLNYPSESKSENQSVQVTGVSNLTGGLG